MKTNLARQSSLFVIAGLIFSLGCARPSAQPEQPRTVAAPAPPPALVVAPSESAPGPVPPATNEAVVASDTNAPAILDRIGPAPQETVNLSPGLSEITRLAQAGVGEEVILAYIEKYEGRFDVGADQIIYLNDLGVTGQVITAMLKRDGSAETAATLSNPPPPALVQTQVVSNVPQNQVLPSYAEPAPAPEQPAPQVTTQVAPPPTSAEVSYFYDTLSPYGSWMYVSGYGWCWQPTVAVSVPTWRPYMDRGRWYWSDAGWYWSSDYSWGWAPFHYGRWYHHARSGWLWTPGTVWGPSWVSWRYTDGYCGWAPLPPEAHFASGVGFTYYSRRVSVGFDFGLSFFHYSFVPVNNFCDYSPYRYVVPRARVHNYYRNTTVINNYIVGNNNTVINRGMGRETVARSSQNRIREVSLRDRPVQNVSRIRGDQIERQGNQLVAYRPQLPKDPPRIRTAQFANRSGEASSSGGRSSVAGRNGFAATPAANLSGAESRPVTGGRVPSSVGARTPREAAGSSAGQPERGHSRTGQVVAQRNGGGSTTTTANVAATPAAPERPRESRPNDAAVAQDQYRRQQQLRSGPLFGATVGGGQAQPGRRQQTEARPTPLTEPRPPAARPEQNGVPRTTSPVRPQNNFSAGRPTESPNMTARVQPAPQQNPAAVRPARVYSGNESRYGGERTVSPRQAEQTPRFSAPAQQAPQIAAPAMRQYSAPPQQYQAAPRQSSPPQQQFQPQQRQAPSGSGGGSFRGGGGGGGGGREASVGRSERAERGR